MKEVATAIFPALIAALLYFTGFIYLSAYYDYFGVVASELEINTQDIFVNSYVALSTWLQYFGLATAGAALFAGLFIWAMWPLTPTAWRKFLIDQRLAATTLAFMALFAAAYPIANFSGRLRADAILNNLPLLQLTMSANDQKNFPCELTGCAGPLLRLVSATSSTVFAISTRGTRKEFWTYRIPIDQLLYSRAFKYTNHQAPEKPDAQ